MNAEDRPAARLGRALMAARAERGLKRRDLAELAELSYPYLSEIETGRKQPSAGKLQSLAEALGLTPAELLSRADHLPRDTRAIPEPMQFYSALTSAQPPADAPKNTVGAETGLRHLDDPTLELISRSVTETIQAKLRPWLQAEIARLVRDEMSRARNDMA